MALAYDQIFVSAQNKTANSTTIVGTASATIAVGKWVVIFIAKDNTGGGSEETEISVSDSVGNTYTRVKERSTGNPAQGGSHVGMFWAKVTSQIVASSTTVTVTLGGTAANNDAQAFVGHAFTGQPALQTSHSNYWPDSADPTSISLSGMPSQAYLLVYAASWEGVVGDSWTHDANYTSLTGAGTSGGGAASNQQVVGAYRIATLTGDTVDPALTTDRDGAHILAAFYEVPALLVRPVLVLNAVRRATFY